MQTSKNPTVVDYFAEADRASWERAVTKHVMELATVGLRAVCGQACVSQGALEEAAREVGMDKADVHSALLLLHATGSMLHYGTNTRCGSHELHDTAFMQPQFIINTMQYVIREPSGADSNDEVRELDEKIRRNIDNGQALDRFLGTKTNSSGVLTKQFLTHLWQHLKLKSRHHTVLLELTKAFTLLCPLADKNTFLVPAMLPRRALPDEYVMPDWWRPSKAAAVAVMQVDDVARRAEMRIMYKVLAGRLPFGFISELQVCLAQTECVDQHFAPEAAIVDRVSGSVLSVAYTCGRGTVQEWVILSLPHGGGTQSVGDATDCLRIMGWAEVSSRQGSTDWCLFRECCTKLRAWLRVRRGRVYKRWPFTSMPVASWPIPLKSRRTLQHGKSSPLTSRVEARLMCVATLSCPRFRKSHCHRPRNSPQHQKAHGIGWRRLSPRRSTTGPRGN